MKQSTLQIPENQPIEFNHQTESSLDYLIRQGAQQMLSIALQQEVQNYLNKHAELMDDNGQRMVVRNGSAQ